MIGASVRGGRRRQGTLILPAGAQAALKPVVSPESKTFGHPGRHVGRPFVNGGKIDMVNDPLTSAVALARRSPYNPPVRGDAMATPLMMRQDSDAHALIASAVRTLEAEAGGISALKAAIDNGLGRSFTAAIDLIRGVSGRVIVTGMGKSGHVGRKIAATLASTGTP